MNWEETIIFIRKQPEYADLVKTAYLDGNLELNVQRYMSGKEWKETRRHVCEYAPKAVDILDVGGGNGISSVAFAQAGFNVTVVEPDPSLSVGAGAIRLLKERLQLSGLTVVQAYAENVDLQNRRFDVVFCRQALHHANSLTNFVGNISKYLNPGGMLFSVRDHVVFCQADKEWFLKSHPLQKYYGGENAFAPAEYRHAFKKAGFTIYREYGFFDSAINYYPLSADDVGGLVSKQNGLSVVGLLRYLRHRIVKFHNLRHSVAKIVAERSIPGRMYSYLAFKS